VLIDYAHTPDALERVLDALRPLTGGRLLVVFGCGGDRDRQKRPRMGKAAAERADVCIATSDNPRTEPPERILDEVVAGVREAGMPALSEQGLASAGRGYFAHVDRRAAIRLAVRAAQAQDVVLIAGKGHETEQIIGTRREPFDDRDEARAALRLRGEPV
jgi:UDP-N-acetylmuramoyl-L-alanyl-D-glutamate--2,6-diaminopimelate ligase